MYRRGWWWCCGLAVVLACGKSEPSSTETPPASTPSGRQRVEKRAHDEAAKAAGTERSSGHELPIEAAKIVFELTGFQAGTMTVWFADHGATVVVARELTKPVVEKQVTVWKDGKNAMWSVGGQQKTVHVTRLRSKATELAAFPTRQLEMGGYERKPSEKIAGVDADIWFHPKVGTTLGIYKGIQIKQSVKMSKVDQLTQAVSIEEGAALPFDIMTYPADYQVKDLTR